MGAIVIWTRFDEGTESAEVATINRGFLYPFAYKTKTARHIRILHLCYNLFFTVDYIDVFLGKNHC
jgi:hypothetical protein